MLSYENLSLSHESDDILLSDQVLKKIEAPCN